MTSDATEFSDVELTTFLDGEADMDLMQRISTALERDPKLAARVQALDAPVQTLRDAFDLEALDAPALPARFVSPQTSLAKRAMVPAALAASFALGLFIAPAQQTAPTGWVAQVASYQALYVTDTLSGATQDPALTQSTLKQAQAAMAFDFNTAPQMEGLTFKRAQMLAVDGEPLIQLAYLDADGMPFALCITRVGTADHAVKTATSHNLAASSWVRGGLGYVLVGGTDLDRVSGLAEGLIGVI